MEQNVAPGVYFTTIDDSFYKSEDPIKTIVSLHTIFSQRGPDNKVIPFPAKSSNLIKMIFGEPNFRKFGQSYHTAMQWAELGYETSICRLMPSDATFANLALAYKKTKTEVTKVNAKADYDSAVGTPVNKVQFAAIKDLKVGQKVWLTGWYKSPEITQIKTTKTYTSSPLQEFEVKSVEGLKEGMSIFIGSLNTAVTISKIIPASEDGLTAAKIQIKETTIISTVNANDSIKENVTVYEPFTIKTISDVFPHFVTFEEPVKMTIENQTPVYFKTKSIVPTVIKDAFSKKELFNSVNEILGDKDAKKGKKISDEELETVIMAFFPIGRGADYNKFSFKLTQDLSLESTYKDFAVYNFALYDRRSDNGVDVLNANEQFSFSFFPDAMDVNRKSMFIKDLLDEYSQNIQIIMNDKKLRMILIDMYDLDPIKAQDHEIYSKDMLQGNLLFNDNNNNRFSGGSDGSLLTKDGELNWGTKEEVESLALTNATNLLKAFYNGTIDPKLLDRKWVRAKYIWDNNYPVEVKKSMSDLVSTSRPDIRFIADTTLQANEEGEIAFRENLFDVDHYNVTIYPNNGFVKDKFTGKKIPVTSTYNVCKLYAKIKNKLGPHYAIAGYNEKGKLDEMLNVAYSPNQHYRNEFTKHQLNTVLTDPTGIYVMENLTSQKETSALQQNHIADALQVIQIETADFCEKYNFNLRITDSNLAQVQSEISEFLAKWVQNGCCEWIDVRVSSNPLQRAQQRVIADISLKFASIAKIMELNFIVKGEGAQPATK